MPVPEPPGHFLLGHLPMIATGPAEFFQQTAQQYGDLTRLRVGYKRAYFINHPDLIGQVLQSNRFVRTPVTRKLLASFLGEGLFSQEGATHLQQRRLMQPAFHRERLEGYAQTMTHHAGRMAQNWAQNPQRDLISDMMHLTLDIVSEALFGSTREREAAQIGEALHLIQNAVDHEYDYYVLLPDWVPVTRFGRVRRAVQTFQGIAAQVVAQRRGQGQGQDLLSLLLEARDEEDGSRMSDAQVSAQILSLLFAGHETTANTLCWTLYLLGAHPEMQKKLEAELDSVLGGRNPTLADYPKLTYTEMVIKESMRLYPSAWYAERMPTEDTRLGGLELKAGTPVSICVYATHRDPRFFPQPEAFRPERFSEENLKSIPRFAYLPFGAGAHQCIGNSFALMEMRLVLAALCQRFRVQLEPSYQPALKCAITLGIKNGLRVQVLPRVMARA
jgi:cytochrome P450